MIYAEILAGGKGTRFGSPDLPKQFQMLGSKPIIIHTIDQFLLNPRIEHLLVGVPKDWMSYTADLLRKYVPEHQRVEIIAGGETRNETIMNAIRHIEAKYGLTDDDAIVTHDAVRPFVTQRIINDNIDALKDHDAVDTAIPAYDTIIHVDADRIITDIPDRKYIQCGQTPQSFNIRKLVANYQALTVQEKEILTDACKICALKNDKVLVVAGEPFNIKITTVFDLKMANAILMERDNDK